MSLFSTITNYANDAKTSLSSFATKAEVDLSNAKNSITTNISKFTDYAEDKASYVATQAGAIGGDTYDVVRDSVAISPVGALAYWASGTPNPAIADLKGLGGKAKDALSDAIASNPTASSILNGIELTGEAATVAAVVLGGYLLYSAYNHRGEIYQVAKAGGTAAFGLGLDFVPGGGVVKDVGQKAGFL